LYAFVSELKKNDIFIDESLNMVDLYCLAQHYGVWTPMMDWTTDFTVALFFACDGRKDNTDCSVFMLDPEKWNDFASGYSKVFNSDEVIKISSLTPLAMYGKRDDKRMCRQSGNFTVHGNMIWPLEHYKVGDEVLIKIIIPSKVADDIAKYLRCLGITSDSIYVSDDEKDEISKVLKDFNQKKLDELLEIEKKKWEGTPKKDRGISSHIRIKP
jgi:hypothetical protein